MSIPPDPLLDPVPVPAVSVLLPYRDNAATLDEALASIRAQHDIDVEIVAVDDGSRDDGAAIARVHAEADPRVVLVATSGLGIAGALRAARVKARAPLLARMDADDLAHPDRLRLQVDAMHAAGDRVAVVGTRVRAFPEEVVGRGLAAYVDWLNGLVTPEDHARALFVEAPLCHPSTLIRASALDAVGGYRDVEGPEDYDLWLRLAAAGYVFIKVPEVLLAWRHRPGRFTFASTACHPDRILATKARHLAPRLRAEAREIVAWGAGRTGRRVARALANEGVRVAAFYDIDPRKIGRCVYDAPVRAPAPMPRGGEAFVLVCVGGLGPGAAANRAIACERLERAGLAVERDYLAMA